MFAGALVDAHCHAVSAADVGADELERWSTEADQPQEPGIRATDGQVGLAIRRWCAPVLGLPAHAPLDRYLERRGELGGDEVTRRLLRAAESHQLVDTGLDAPDLLDAARTRRRLGRGRPRGDPLGVLGRRSRQA